MKGIIKIEQRPNGAHQNQLGTFQTVPDGWAVIPADMELPPSFPFVDITVEEAGAPEEEGEQELRPVPTVTGMTERAMPQPGPEWEPEEENTVWDQLDAAYQEGVNEV